jgi:uncharacterized protein (DUF1810 family)
VNDPYHLQRFLDAQESVFHQVVIELREGRKQSHWMWFVFPQIAGLGHSEMANRYAITSMQEAEAYLADPVLGERLKTCTQLVNLVRDKTAEQVFGYPDHLKFHSSMTLFAQVDPGDSGFTEALRYYFGGKEDDATLALIPRPSD